MRAGVIIDGVTLKDKQEFVAAPIPGDVIEHEGGEAVVKRLRHNLLSRQAFIVCETEKAVLAVDTFTDEDRARLKEAMKDVPVLRPGIELPIASEELETNTETPAESSPTQAIRRSGKRRRG